MTQYTEKFEDRHIGPDGRQIEEMLKVVKAKSLDELIGQTIPSGIRLKKALNLPAAQSEFEFLKTFKGIVSKNKVFRSFIGTGYYGTITPGVIWKIRDGILPIHLIRLRSHRDVWKH